MAERELCAFEWPESDDRHLHECRYYADLPHTDHQCYLCGDEAPIRDAP